MGFYWCPHWCTVVHNSFGGLLFISVLILLSFISAHLFRLGENRFFDEDPVRDSVLAIRHWVFNIGPFFLGWRFDWFASHIYQRLIIAPEFWLSFSFSFKIPPKILNLVRFLVHSNHSYWLISETQWQEWSWDSRILGFWSMIKASIVCQLTVGSSACTQILGGDSSKAIIYRRKGRY